MANSISKIKIPSGTVYEVKDDTSRGGIADLRSKIDNLNSVVGASIERREGSATSTYGGTVTILSGIRLKANGVYKMTATLNRSISDQPVVVELKKPDGTVYQSVTIPAGETTTESAMFGNIGTTDLENCYVTFRNPSGLVNSLTCTVVIDTAVAKPVDNISKKLDKPSTEGTAGQVPASDGNGGTEWVDMVNNFHTYYAELDRWQIPNDGTDAQTTTSNINLMITWAKTNGYNAVSLPGGTYLIHGINENYTDHQRLTDAGIIMPDDMALLLSDDTVLQMETNGYKTYSCITFHNKPSKNILIKGGKILGDRKTHDFNGESGSHEYGYAILATACENVVIDGVYFDGFTGDALMISNVGSATTPETYFPAVNVKVLNCVIKNSCRNNISITGCDNVTIAGCYIAGAGTADENHDGTAPRFGIDVEGYGEGDVDFAITRRVNVIGNVFEGNVAAACDFLTGYECVAIDNISDGQFGYSYGNNVVISNNIFYKKEKETSGSAAIAGNGVSSGYDGNYTIISGNTINGFATGLSLRGEKVLAIGNKISNVSTGIGTYECTDCEIISNTIDSYSGYDGVDGTGIGIGQSTNGLMVKGNIIRNGIVSCYAIRMPSTNAGGNIHIIENDISDGSIGIVIEKGTEIYICNNIIKGMRSNWGLITLYSTVDNVDISGNIIRNNKAAMVECSLGNANTNNRVRIRDNTFYLSETATGVLISKPLLLDVINNTMICDPSSNNNRDCITITGDSVEGVLMNRIIGNLFICDNSYNMRWAIRAEKGGSLIAWNRLLTGSISSHADDTLIDNYQTS